jgi:hypothetical protein
VLTNYLNLNFQTPEQLKFSCMAIAEGARLAGHINSETLSDIYNPESESDRIKDRISSSSSDDEDSGPPPLPPPRTESLIKEAPIYQQRQNGIAAIANPEFEIPDRLAEAETVNGACDHDQDQEESSLKFDVSSNFLFFYLINKVRNYFRVYFFESSLYKSHLIEVTLRSSLFNKTSIILKEVVLFFQFIMLDPAS